MILILAIEVLYNFGPERVGSFSSDNTGNTRVARLILHQRLPRTLNLPDPDHHINNTWKEIAELEYFSSVCSTSFSAVELSLTFS